MGTPPGSLTARRRLLEAVREQLPDLILMDIMMPGMDGLQALRLLKQDRRTAGVPVIFLTAKSSEIDKVKGLDLGAEDYITKPLACWNWRPGCGQRCGVSRRSGSTSSAAATSSSMWTTTRSPGPGSRWSSP